MQIVITQVALDSYLTLKYANAFTPAEYKAKIRPQVELLRDGVPSPHPELQNSKVLSFATDRNGAPIPDCFKMKWHNLNERTAQLRLGLVVYEGEVFLGQAYTKTDAYTDKREMAKLKALAIDIRNGHLKWRELL